MLSRLREYVRNESPGITVPVGFVLFEAIRGVVFEVVVAFETTHSPKATVLGITFYWTGVLPEFIALVTMALIFFILFAWPWSGAVRRCPECKSRIAEDARRCAFCTSLVEPPASAASSMTAPDQ